MTLVDRHTSCILAWRVDWERSEALLQSMIDEAPQAKFYYSDLFATYRNLVYAPGRYTPMPDKSETFRVEGDNAEFRHYLARLARALAVFRAVSMRCVGQSSCLFTCGIVANCIASAIPATRLISFSSFAHEFRHSLFMKCRA